MPGRQTVKGGNHDIICRIGTKSHPMRRDVKVVTSMCEELSHLGGKSDEINNTPNI